MNADDRFTPSVAFNFKQPIAQEVNTNQFTLILV